ncbi:hypothetical protein E8E14_008651 [Neopestalotiopsis sp. 37M]|nr:hypothetical protein E8E14_008651 [Neopestalotiopsis sp. 37M]
MASSSTMRQQDDDFRENDRHDETDESDMELPLKRDDRTIQRSKDKKTTSSDNNDEILYEETKSSRSSGAGRNKAPNANDGFAPIFEIMHQYRDLLLDCDLTKPSPDAEFWQTVLGQVVSAGLGQVDNKPRPRLFSSWSSFKASMLKKMPKHDFHLDGKDLMRHQFLWWWSFYELEVACYKVVKPFEETNGGEGHIMTILGIDSSHDMKSFIFTNEFLDIKERLRKKLHQPHSKTQRWSVVPDDHTTNDDAMDYFSEDVKEKSPSPDPNAVPSIEYDSRNGSEYGHGDDNETDGTQEDQASSQSMTYTRIKTADPEEQKRLNEFEQELIEILIARRADQPIGLSFGSPIQKDEERRLGQPRSPILGTFSQTPDKRVPRLRSDTPASVISSRKSAAAVCTTPPSLSPSPTPCPPKPLVQLLGPSETPRPSPKPQAHDRRTDLKKDNIGQVKVLLPILQTTDHDKASQGPDMTEQERRRRDHTHPELRQANADYRLRKQKVNRGDIPLRPSHLIPQTMLKKPGLSNVAQTGKEVAPNTSRTLSQSLTIRDQAPTAISRYEPAVQKDNHDDSDCDSNSDLIQNDETGSPATSDDDIPRSGEGKRIVTTPISSTQAPHGQRAQINETNSRSARKEKRKRNRAKSRGKQSVQPPSPHTRHHRAEQVKSPTLTNKGKNDTVDADENAKDKETLEGSQRQPLTSPMAEVMPHGSQGPSKKRKTRCINETAVPQQPPDDLAQRAKKRKKSKLLGEAPREDMDVESCGGKIEELAKVLAGLVTEIEKMKEFMSTLNQTR